MFDIKWMVQVRFRSPLKKLILGHGLDEARWQNLASCKIMWGAAELYRLTGEAEYGQTAKRILDHFCQTQHDWGGWVHTLWFDGPDDQPFGATADIIYELCGEITETVFNLSGR